MVNFRIKNPTPLQWGLIGTTTAVVLGLSTAAYASSRRGPKVTPPPPPSPDDELPDLPPPPTDEDTEWEIRGSTDPGYPWTTPTLHVENWPTPGMWVDLNDTGGSWSPSNGFDSLVRAALGSALVMAGNDVSIATAEGQDPKALLGRKLRQGMRNAIIYPGGINDLLYGQTNANLAGGVDPGKPCTSGSTNAPCTNGIRDPNATRIAYMMNSYGRGLNWVPRHADILNQIANGEILQRGTSITGTRLPGIGGQHQMVVWIPAVDLVALGPNEPSPSIKFLKWDDNVPTLQPPPIIRALGVNLNGVNLPGA